MKYFKRFGCNHDYIHYLTQRDNSFSDIYCFICRNCEKEIRIYEWDIKNKSEKLKVEISKEIALDLNVSSYKDYRYSIGDHVFEGKLAYYLEKQYPNINQGEEKYKKQEWRQ